MFLYNFQELVILVWGTPSWSNNHNYYDKKKLKIICLKFIMMEKKDIDNKPKPQSPQRHHNDYHDAVLPLFDPWFL